VSARTRILLVLAVGAFATVLEHAPGLAALAALSVGALVRAGGGWSRVALAGIALAASSTITSQGLFWGGAPRTPLVALGPVVVWQEGVAHGLVQALRFVASGCAGAALALSTPPDRLAGGLAALRVPAGVAFLATTALRFVPLALEEWRTVRAARAARVRSAPGWRLDRRLRAEAEMLRPVVARAARRSSILATSLVVRGFDPARVVLPPDARPTLGENVLLGGVAALFLALVALRLTYAAWLGGLLTDPALRPLMAFARHAC
jgi:energy-coupling factor transport system permease protein